MIRSILIFFTLILLNGFTSDSRAAVYSSDRLFTQADEINYSLWIKEKVSSDIFSNPISPYFGIKTDCADAAIALRAIYAFEQNLAFSFIDNAGRKISNNSTLFDSRSEDSLVKLKAMIDFMAENIGSEALADQNTYPVNLKSLLPGDLYITKWRNSSGTETRHVYIIKEILATGDLLLFSSTQPRAIRPLLARKGMPLHFFSEKPFGFRRFFPLEAVALQDLEQGSLMQYELAKSGEKIFYSTLKQLLKTNEDTLQLNFSRRIDNVCVALTARKDIVEMAIVEKNKLGKKCFSSEVYDEYSTPSRDLNIIKDIERLRNGYKSIVNEGRVGELKEETKAGLDYLIGASKSQEGLDAIKDFCFVGVELSENQSINVNMKSFFDRYQAKLISSNPNETLGARWGLSKESKACPEKKK